VINPAAPAPVLKPTPRLASLDAYRGFIMILLAAHGFGLAALARSPAESPVWRIVNRSQLEWLAFHFDHPPWQSSFVFGTHDATIGPQWKHWVVSFWDLIQPAFMFMVGVAIPFSCRRRLRLGETGRKRTLHALVRAVVLVLLGVFLYSLGKDSTNWIFPNVLAQIGLGYFFVFLLQGKRMWIPCAALILILAGTWSLVQFTPAPANYAPEKVNARYDHGEVYLPPYRQWSKNGNVFATFDVWFLNLFPRPADEGPFHFNRGGYQTLNFVPAMGTMILGLLCGNLLLSKFSPWRKLMWLVLAAVVCWGLGVLAGSTCCPIVKRIWTPSWVLFSGGYVIGMLAIFYLLFDLLRCRWLAFPLIVVGMNSLLAYLMGELLRGWFAENVNRHFGWAIDGGLGWLANFMGLNHNLGAAGSAVGETMHLAFLPVVEAISALAVIWLLCLWLYRQRVFLRI
jgi:predicted acyltransferase